MELESEEMRGTFSSFMIWGVFSDFPSSTSCGKKGEHEKLRSRHMLWMILNRRKVEVQASRGVQN